MHDSRPHRRSPFAFAFALVLAFVSASTVVDAKPKTPREQALELFDRGKKAYQEGRFAESAALLTEAYDLEKEPVLVYNLARAQDGLGEFEKAIASYELYLSTAKEVPDRGAIEQRLTTLKKAIEDKARLASERDAALRAQEEAAKAPPVAPPPKPPAPVAEPDSASAAPWIIAGLGALGVGAGATLGALALSKDSDAGAATTSQVDAVDLHDSATGLALGATIAFTVGGVVLGTGLIWGIVDVATLDGAPGEDASGKRDFAPPPRRVMLRLGPSAATLVVEL